MSFKYFSVLPLVFISLFVQAQKNDQTLPFSDAIVIRNTQCKKIDSVLTYKGTIKNISNYSTYKAILTSDFLFKKNGRKYKTWDKKNKSYLLKPNESYDFIFKSRIYPDSFNMKCSHEVSGRFLSSTI